jgi:hypothetical protein
MGFQHIKVLADKVLKDATAAHADKLRMNLGGDGPMSQGEGEPLSPSPMLKQPGGAVASNENEKDGARSPASYTGVRVSSGRTNTPPTIGRDTTTAPHELPRSAVVVSLAMVRAQRHAAPRSITL